MLSINTNLSSLIAQQSMSSATNKLNQAIERMTTGYKINGAKDNAANYSISNNMQTQLSSYDVAADNVAMGMDLVTTASDIINNMQDKATRLQALCTQARNGTYGAQSMAAINSEASAIMAEINRLYMTAEYNNVSLFNREAFQLSAEHQALTESLKNNGPTAKAEYNSFIEDPKTYTDEEVAAMTRVKDVSTFSSGQKYAIYTKEELEKLRDYVNGGNSTSGVEFVLSADIDLSSISNWTPIGDYSTNSSYQFKGTFDGNGHVIKNLTIDNDTKDYQGLFGRTASGAIIKNIGLEGGEVKGKQYTGGLVGRSSSTISNSYATGSVTGSSDHVGGLVGSSSSGTISNSYATGDVTSSSYSVGGLVGYSAYSSISNSYATGAVTGSSSVGGLVGRSYSDISNSYATGAVSGQNDVGGLVGYSEYSISNSYATGSVSGTYCVGGLVGNTYAYESGTLDLTNNYATGAVSGTSNVGGLVGEAYAESGTLDLTNNYATGDVSGTNNVGGLVGYVDLSIVEGYETKIVDCASYSKKITGTESVGSLIGGYCGEEVNGWYTPGVLTIENCSTISELSGIGGYYTYDEDMGDTTYVPDHDLSAYNEKVAYIPPKPTQTTLQVGIKSDSSCQITFDTNFKFDLSAIEGNIASDEALAAINDFTNLLSEKSTQLGAVQNRLDSAIESITVNMENLTSSLSTIRDADIAEVSSQYIQQQILQQASATLLATANQSPSIALQLI